jgi:hypothetical protein
VVVAVQEALVAQEPQQIALQAALAALVLQIRLRDLLPVKTWAAYIMFLAVAAVVENIILTNKLKLLLQLAATAAAVTAVMVLRLQTMPQ